MIQSGAGRDRSPNRGKRLFKWSAALIVFFLLAAAVALLLREPEPLVRGMTLTEWLGTADRSEVNEGIAEVGPAAIPFLIKHVKTHENAWGEWYHEIWPRIPQFIQARLTPPSRHESRALQALRDFGPESQPALPAILEFLSNTNVPLRRRYTALEAAVSIAPESQAVADLYQDWMATPRERSRALIAVVFTGYYPTNLRSLLLPLKIDSDKPTFSEVNALAAMGPEAGPAVPELIAGLSDPRMRSGYNNFLIALSKIGPDATPAVPILRQQLQAGSPMKMSIAEALMNIGPPAGAALPDLRLLLTDDSVGVRAAAAAAIIRIDGPDDQLTSVIASGVTNTVEQSGYINPIPWPEANQFSLNANVMAAWLLGDLAPDTRSALPLLRETIGGEASVLLKVTVARALWKLDHDSKIVLPVLQAALQDSTNEARVLACLTLAEMGAAAAPAIPDLEAACNRSLSTRRAALMAIDAIQRASDRSTSNNDQPN